ncbi:Chitooligosaccharide deacetylase [Halomicronema hongdechloris C2206]|uniref:Chitooligosaccharide deacetylase n=1 Tax=Halomicronema hongdechloris C2206 TaxID=1641165 RepID=A0A1Z3HL20_9CYAN|nr:polysaccharide deacetylase family protein [Halomicronema hongdechloris]ASC70985.1 Chitooligosaccharide deacetylase [Halomicronema hongdechloris C2206]
MGLMILAIVLLVLAAGTLVLAQPRPLLRLIQALSPGVLFFVETSQPLVALTIDDGPDGETTPDILAVLARYQVTATFFLISSRVPGQGAVVTAMVAQGHELGNHLTEDRPSITLSRAEFTAALTAAHDCLAAFAAPRWLRPASGWYRPAMVDIAHRHGYGVALGAPFPFDTHIPSVDFACGQILTTIRPGSIIILHDGGQRGRRTLVVLERLLPVLQGRGYRVVSLSELVALAS